MFTISSILKIQPDARFSGAKCVGAPSTNCSHDRPLSKILDMSIHIVTRASRWKADIINVEICFLLRFLLDNIGIKIAN